MREKGFRCDWLLQQRHWVNQRLSEVGRLPLESATDEKQGRRNLLRDFLQAVHQRLSLLG